MNISDCYCRKCGGSERDLTTHPRENGIRCLPGERKNLVDAINIIKTHVPVIPGAETIAILKDRISSIDSTIKYNKQEKERKLSLWKQERQKYNY